MHTLINKDQGPGPGAGGRKRAARLLVPLLIAAIVWISPASLALAQDRDEAAEPVEPQALRASIDGGLKWLAARQITEGPEDEIGSFPGGRYPVATTALAGLAFLAHGYTPGEGEYGQVVERAMQYIRRQQAPNGYLGNRGESMYIHAMATLFALSYLGMAEDAQVEPELAEWCRRSVKLILDAQTQQKRSYEQGGWRYSPAAIDSDVSVTSWQLLTLHAARQCGYEVDQRIFNAALRYIDSAWMEVEPDKAADETADDAGDTDEVDGAGEADEEPPAEADGEEPGNGADDGDTPESPEADQPDDGADADEADADSESSEPDVLVGFAYRPGVSLVPEPGVTGAALAIQTVLGQVTEARSEAALGYLDAYPPSWGGTQYKGAFYFVSFYMAQGYFQRGDDAWRPFSNKLNRVLLGHQGGDGRWPFPPDTVPQAADAGEAYATAMALLLLGIDNQYLPMYQRQAELFSAR